MHRVLAGNLDRSVDLSLRIQCIGVASFLSWGMACTAESSSVDFYEYVRSALNSGNRNGLNSNMVLVLENDCLHRG